MTLLVGVITVGAMFGPDLIPVIKSIGYLGIFISVVLESGVILFFFMPSDSLLFAAGFLASQNILDIKLVIPVCFVGGVLGYMIGYFLGQKAEPKLRSGKISKYIDAKQLEDAEAMYRKYANMALLLARFFPIRAFVSFFAGAAAVPYRTFMFYNVAGAALWSVSLTLLGFFFGEFFTPDDLDSVFIFIFLVFIFGVAGMGIFVHNRASHARKKVAAMESEKK